MAQIAIVNDSAHGMVIHKAGCRDLDKLNPYRQSVWVAECASIQEIVTDVYADMMAEDDSPWTSYLSEFTFKPCVPNLPDTL